MNEQIYCFGYPNELREIKIFEALKDDRLDKHYINYRGKYRPIPIIEVPIELPVYRIENIRTKSLQKEWLSLHPEIPKDIFIGDPYSIAAQETQHQILKKLIDKENLFKTFKNDDKLQQTEPLICSSNGTVVNGNRRLCAWRELYYGDKFKYAHFQSIRIAVLPDNDPQGIYDLEVALQISSDMKAEYVWHAIAADYVEKFEAGVDIGEIARRQNKKPEDIRMYIECYQYAAQYLETIGQPDQWSMVDKQEYAFKQIVIGRQKITNPGDKELFQEIVYSLLQSPVSGDRLYKQIPKVVANLRVIADQLKKNLNIQVDESSDDDLDLLMSGDETTNGEDNAKIAAGIRSVNDPLSITKIVNDVLDNADELEKEKKKKSFIFDQVFKAATCLTNAVSALDDIMTKDGIARQLDNIDGACLVLKDWIKK